MNKSLTMRGSRRGSMPEGLTPIQITSGDAEEAGEPLSPGARVFHEGAMNCHIIAVVGLMSPIDVAVIREGLRETLINHPRFSSNYVVDVKNGGKKIWVRTQVNLDDHIVIPNLHTNMDSLDEFADDYISNLTTTSLDMSRPLWELHLLNIKTSDAESMGVLKIHHSLGDGISLISLLLACTRKTSDPDLLPSLPKKKEVATSSHQNGVLRYLGLIWLLCKVLMNTLVGIAVFLATVMFLKDTHTPVKGSPGTEKKRKLIVHQILSLDDIKLIKNQMNMSINDVILGVTQAGLSQYLNKKYGTISNSVEVGYNKKDNLPKNIRLRATVLVNVRPSSGIQELASLMEKGSKCPWGNTIGYIILPFHIAMKDDPLDHIRQAKAIADKKKQSLESKFTYGSAMLMLRLLSEKAVAALSYRLISQTTMSLSNVVGPSEHISFYGHPIAYIAPTVCGHPQALTIHYQSHVDKMTVVVAADEEVLSDPRVLCHDIAESLSLIKAALVKNGTLDK